MKTGIDLAVPSITVWLMEPSDSTSTRRGYLARAAEALPPNSTAISSLFAPVTRCRRRLGPSSG